MVQEGVRQYRKLPVVIKAIQYLGENLSEVLGFIQEGGGKAHLAGRGYASYLIITTLEGDMSADPGDWVIRGIKGEFSPCKDEIFRATYELVDKGAVSW